MTDVKLNYKLEAAEEFEMAPGSEEVQFGSKKGASTVDFDQNGILYAIATDFSNKEWKNPFDTKKVDVNFSEDACNYYSTDQGHEKKQV